MLVTQAFRFELDPNDKCRSKLASHAGAARFAYNWGVSLVSNHLAGRRALVVLAMRQGAGRKDAECWADGLLGPVPWTLPALRRPWNRAKAEVAPWWAENSKECYSSGLDALARGLDAWSKSRRGTRKGRRVGFPRFKAKHARRSFRVTTGAFGVTDSRHVRLPRIGVIRTKEPATKLAGLLGASAARVLSATVAESAGRWYVSFGVEVDRLNVAGMTASAKGSGRWRGKAGLNRAVLDAAPGELRRQLSYKTAWYGSRLVVADRWYPSSKTCSRCKTVKAKLSLPERTYRCERCGLVADRDLNAAANLASLVESVTSTGTASGAGTGRDKLPVNAQGEERFMGSPRCSSANCEDGTSSELGKTVTATRQRVAPKPVLAESDR
jgi:transposase